MQTLMVLLFPGALLKEQCVFPPRSLIFEKLILDFFSEFCLCHFFLVVVGGGAAARRRLLMQTIVFTILYFGESDYAHFWHVIKCVSLKNIYKCNFLK